MSETRENVGFRCSVATHTWSPCRCELALEVPGRVLPGCGRPAEPFPGPCASPKGSGTSQEHFWKNHFFDIFQDFRHFPDLGFWVGAGPVLDPAASHIILLTAGGAEKVSRVAPRPSEAGNMSQYLPPTHKNTVGWPGAARGRAGAPSCQRIFFEAC